MSDREAFERWVCDLNRAPTAWEGWQAALQSAGQEPVAYWNKNFTFASFIKLADHIEGEPPSGWVPLYTHPQTVAVESLASWMLSRGFSTGHGDTIDDLLTELDGQIDDLQHDGQGDAVAEIALSHGGYPVCRWLKGDEENYAEGTKFYTHPQPAVPDGWIKVMRGMAEYAECNDPRNPYLRQAQALLSAGKETDK
jgi:hypothetical protein